MTTRAEEMEALLRERFSPRALFISDDSAKHAGHAGARPEGQTHFSVKITADAFAGKSRVERHRMVYDVLAPFFAQGLHALAIEAGA